MIEPEEQARIYKVLSVGTRVKMLEILKQHTLCVNALAKMLDITPSAVSQHLRVLRDAGIVTADKRGYFVHYGINQEAMEEWRAITEALFKVRKSL